MADPVIHFEIIGKDAPRLQRFYAELFGWAVDADNPLGYGLVPAEDGGIGGGIGPTQDGAPATRFYVGVPDLQAALDAAAGLGGTVVMPPMEVPGGPLLAFFSDPDGNVIGLMGRS